MVRRRPASCALRGQALVESVVVLLALLVVLYGIVIVAKRADVAHGAIVGARYAAFERTVWTSAAKADTALAKEIRSRVFAAPGSAWSGSDAPLNPMWTRRDGTPLLADYSDGDVSLSEQKTSGAVFNSFFQGFWRYYNEVVGILAFIGDVRPPRIDFNIEGAYSAASRPRLRADDPAAPRTVSMLDAVRFPEIGELTLARRPVVIVTDTWSPAEDGKAGKCDANASDTTVCKVAALTPTTFAGGWVNDVLDVIGYVAYEFRKGQLQFGYIDPVSAPQYPKEAGQ